MPKIQLVTSLAAASAVVAALVMPSIAASAVPLVAERAAAERAAPVVYQKIVGGKTCGPVLIWVDPNNGEEHWDESYVRIKVSAGGTVKVYVDGRLFQSRQGTFDTWYTRVNQVRATSTAHYPTITVSCFIPGVN